MTGGIVFSDLWHKVHDLVARMRRDRRGSMMVWVGVSIVPLLLSVGLAVDISRGYLLRSKLNTALDAAALAGGSRINDPERDVIVQQYFDANFPPGYLGATVGELNIQEITAPGEPDRLAVSVEASLPTLIMRLAGASTFSVDSSAEITVSSKSVEVGLALDITGSMAGQRIVDLRAAAKELISIVVQNDQDPFYSKVAIAPYSNAVNVGPYADEVRGVIPPPLAIVNASKTNPVVVTTGAPHNFVNNQLVYITAVNGMTQLNKKVYTVENPTSTTFRLKGVDGRSYNTYTGSGVVGAVCDQPGCTFQRFQSVTGATKVHGISTCVSEREGDERYTNAAPSTSTTKVGMVYPNTPFEAPQNWGENPCPTSIIMPLSSDRDAMNTAIDDLDVSGSTAGQIGLAWAWYLVSEPFGYLFPAESRPGTPNANELLKVVVLMTDGAFNSVYCRGVLAKNSTSGSGSSRDHINCDSPNGDSFAQADALCDAMKQNGIIIYTVGFGVSDSEEARNLFNDCATDPSHVYFPETGGELRQAFREIAISISRLRLSR